MIKNHITLQDVFESSSIFLCISNYIPCYQDLTQYRSMWLVIICWLSSYIFSNVYIFNICIRCIWLNSTYIMTNICRTIMLFDCAIDPILCYHKRPVIWSFILICSFISKNWFISDFIVVVKLFYYFCGLNLN